MNLPIKYDWLNTITPLPKVIATALQYLGIKEIPGASSNPVIMNMAKQLGVDNIYKNDDTSWCALFVSFICVMCGKPLPDTNGDKYNILRAAWFLNYGHKVEIPELGDILVFDRPGGNHVGFYIAESDTTYFVLGGNQSDAVTISEIKKSRLRQARRFYNIAPPSTVKVYKMNASGLVSTNEA
ncbi:conserved hypothetical protein [Gammaproteobacteria bacterium]